MSKATSMGNPRCHWTKAVRVAARKPRVARCTAPDGVILAWLMSQAESPDIEIIW